MLMQRSRIATTNARAAIGQYNQAIRCGQFVYPSGQIALDPASGELVGDDIQAQAQRVLENLQAVLASAGSSLANVIKTTVFLAHMRHFHSMNAVYTNYFDGTNCLMPTRPAIVLAD